MLVHVVIRALLSYLGQCSRLFRPRWTTWSAQRFQLPTNGRWWPDRSPDDPWWPPSRWTRPPTKFSCEEISVIAEFLAVGSTDWQNQLFFTRSVLIEPILTTGRAARYPFLESSSHNELRWISFRDFSCWLKKEWRETPSTLQTMTYVENRRVKVHSISWTILCFLLVGCSTLSCTSTHPFKFIWAALMRGTY